MIKYINERLSLKIFLLTLLILMGIAIATYGFVAFFLPVTYSEALNENLEAKAHKMSEALSGCSIENGFLLLDDFSQETQSSLLLVNDLGEVVYEKSVVYTDVLYGSLDVQEDSVVSYDEGWAISSVTEGGGTDVVEESAAVGEAYIQSADIEGKAVNDLEQQAMARYPVTFQGSDEEYTLFVFGSRAQVNQAVAALRHVLPWLLLTIFMVSLFAAVFYSRYLTKPVISLSRISRQMAQLDFQVQSRCGRKDEIGVLGESLDTLAHKLDEALKNLTLANACLKSDIEKERETEKKRMEFFAAASHELKTPVTILKGQIQGMLEGVGSYKDKERTLLRSREVVASLESMVQEILTISRMESHNFTLKKQEKDFAELIRLSLADLTELFEQKEMKIEVSLPDSLFCLMDPVMMKTVVHNLLMNALSYSPRGAKIAAWLREEEKQAVLRIENSGVWIPPGDLEKLFDAFYRVDSSRNRKKGGSGLGLYIVREILEQHGAGYRIENTASGVQFTLWLDKNSTENTHN